MRIREHRGSLADSMKTMRTVHGSEELVAVINASLAPFGVTVAPAAIVVMPYGRDIHTGWDTHLITIVGYGVWGMADGPIDDCRSR